MNQYNDIYILNEISKRLNEENKDFSSQIKDILNFIESSKNYEQFRSFEQLRNTIFNIINNNVESKYWNIDIRQIKDSVDSLIKDIELINNEHLKDYNYIEEKLKNIIYKLDNEE